MKETKPKSDNAPTNTREIRRQTNRRMTWMVLLTLLGVGGGVTMLVYGPAALLGVMPVLLFGVALIALPYLVLKGLEKWLRWYENRHQ